MKFIVSRVATENIFLCRQNIIRNCDLSYLRLLSLAQDERRNVNMIWRLFCSLLFHELSCLPTLLLFWLIKQDPCMELLNFSTILIILDIYWNVTSGHVSIPRVYGVRAVQSDDNGSHLGLTLIRISDKQGFVITMFTLTIALRCLREEFLVWWHFLARLSLDTEPYYWPLIGQLSLDVSPWSPVSEVIITDAGTIYIPWPQRRHFQ